MTDLTHDEVIDLLNAADRGPGVLLPHVQELVNLHREQARMEAELAATEPLFGHVSWPWETKVDFDGA